MEEASLCTQQRMSVLFTSSALHHLAKETEEEGAKSHSFIFCLVECFKTVIS